MNRENYQRILDRTIETIQEEHKIKTLLLHSCCAPCSSYCLSYLARYFQITVFYYNPNITEKEEYQKRVEEQKRLIHEFNKKFYVKSKETPDMEQEMDDQYLSFFKISFVEGDYDPERFYEMAKGLENAKEGGQRCFLCYEMRQRKAAIYAKAHGFDFFTTTLSVSPHKNADKLNEIGVRISKEYGIPYLISDFKKKGGYQKSIELSKEYQLYRQNYCGCEFSKQSHTDKLFK